VTPTAYVVGATGYTGRNVVAACLRRQARTVAHVRPDSPRLELWRQRFDKLGAEIDTTPWQAEAMIESVRRLQPTHVFSLLGTTRSRGAADGGTYETVDYGLTMLLLEAVVEAPPPRPRFVYLSAIGAGALEATGAYMRARVRCEQRIRETDLDYLLVRPSLITGPDRDESRLAERSAAKILDGALGLVGLLGATGLRDRYHSRSGAELAHAIVEAALDPSKGRRAVEMEEISGYAREPS
jgi:nucleoside-diphosphate-sugar epimerase